MKIAIVTPYAEPEKGAAVARVESFRSFFSSKGNQVHVLAPERGVSGHDVIRYPSIRSLLRSIFSLKPSVLIGTSPPITHNFFLALECRFLGIPFILDSKDPYTYLASRLKQSSGIKLSVYRVMEILTHRIASRIFVLTPLDKEMMDREYSFPEGRVSVIRNGAEPEKIFFSAKHRLLLRKSLKIKKNPVILYAGVMGGKDLDVFLEKSGPLLRKHDAHLLFIFTTDKTPFTNKIYENILSSIRSSGLEGRTHIFFNIPYEKLYQYFSAADMAISPVPDFWVTNLPTKVFDYLACEIPVVAKGPPEGSMASFFKEHDAGFFSSTWDGFLKNLEFSIKNLKSTRKKGISGRKAIESHFSRETFCKKALEIILSLRTSV